MFKWHTLLCKMIWMYIEINKNNSHLSDFFVFVFLVFFFPGNLSVSAVPEFDQVCSLEMNSGVLWWMGSCFLSLDRMTNQDALLEPCRHSSNKDPGNQYGPRWIRLLLQSIDQIRLLVYLRALEVTIVASYDHLKNPTWCIVSWIDVSRFSQHASLQHTLLPQWKVESSTGRACWKYLKVRPQTVQFWWRTEGILAGPFLWLFQLPWTESRKSRADHGW